MKLYTSYFDNAKKLIDDGDVQPSRFVCVAGYVPKWFYDRVGTRFYPDLSPRKTWWQEWYDKSLGNDWYEQKYRETVLSRLNPNKVVEELGYDSILLCYEKPDEFCHRHIIARWIGENIGNVEVMEFENGQ